MCLRKETPCDFGPCPYDADYFSTCEYWCGVDEEDINAHDEIWEEEEIKIWHEED